MTTTITSRLDDLYSTNNYASFIYYEVFNVFPSRLIVSDVTKGFFKKVREILNLEVLLEDYGYDPKNIKDLRKTIYLDSTKSGEITWKSRIVNILLQLLGLGVLF